MQECALFPLLSSADGESQQWHKHIGSFTQNSLALARIHLLQKILLSKGQAWDGSVSLLSKGTARLSHEMREGESQSYDSQLTLGSVALGTLSSLRQS